MKVLITGGTGFIGNHVVRMCLAQGDDVRVMVLPGEDLSSLEGLDVELVEGDLAHPYTLEKVVQGVDALYHLAAIFKFWLPHSTLMFDVNVTGTRELMRYAMQHKLKKVVYTSSIAAVGVAPGTSMADENTGFNNWRADDYILSKYMSEQEVRGLIGKGLPAVIVNPAFPFGPGDRVPTPTGEIIINIMKNKFPIPPTGGMSAVDVRDVAQGHLLAMQKGKIGESYILANSSGNLTFLELFKLVRKVAGKKQWPDLEIPAGRALVSLAGWLEKVADITGNNPLFTVKSAEAMGNCYFYSSQKAVQELGLPQSPIEDSIRDAISWFEANGYL